MLASSTFFFFIGTWRVGGVLAVSRAFGDRLLKQYVVADPEIQVRFGTCSQYSFLSLLETLIIEN